MPEENVGGANAGGQSQPGAAAGGSDGAGGSNAQNQGGSAGAGAGGDGAKPGAGAGDAGAGANAGVHGDGKAAGDPAAAAGADGKPAAAITPDWPADWRTKAAAGDEATVKMLERFASPLDLVKKIREQDKLISSGQLKQPLPKDATPEQLAEYRKQNGIPESADKYEINLPEGFKIDANDKPVIDAILGAAHSKNASPEVVNAMIAAYYQQEAAFNNQMEESRDKYHQACDDILHKEWGGEYRGEVNRINNLLATFPDDARAALQDGKDNNGMRLLDNIGLMRGLAALSRQLNPVTTILPGSGGDQAQSVDTEIAAIEKRFSGSKEEADAYYKDAPAQARLRELYDWRDNQKKKSA